MFYYKNYISSIIPVLMLVTATYILLPRQAQGQEQQNAQWPFYLAFEDATGAKDTLWLLADTASTFYFSVSGLFGEVPIPPDSVNFQVWFYHPAENSMPFDSWNKYNTTVFQIENNFPIEASIHASNYELPITVRWDSSLFHADVLYEYGDPVNRAYFDNQYFFLQSNSWTHEFELMLDNHAVMPYFWWGSSDHFPLFILITRGPGDPLGTIQNDEAEFSIFPNPATNHILMEFPESVNADFRIYKADGMLVKSGSVVGDQTKINLDGFAAGLYFVEIQD